MSVRENLERRRPEILRAELAAHLHVVGRMREGWGQGEEQKFNISKIVDLGKSPHSIDSWKSLGERGVLNRSKECPVPNDELFNSVQLTFPSTNSSGLALDLPLGVFLTLWKLPSPKGTSEKATEEEHAGDYERRMAPFLGSATPALAAFNAAHTKASVFKKGPQDDTSPLQQAPQCKSTVFGAESEAERFSEMDLEKLVSAGIAYGKDPARQSRKTFLELWKTKASRSSAETQKPIYDIDNWTYGDAVAAFFKTAMARLWATDKWPASADGFQWTLLAVGYPGLEFIAEAVRVADVIGRRNWLKEKLDSIQAKLEFEVPVAQQIYRDENGAVFLICEYEGETQVLTPLAKDLVDECIDADDDIHPYAEEQPWKEIGLPPVWAAIENLRQGGVLRREALERWWFAKAGKEVCAVCALRPQAEHGQGQERELCSVCFERREDRCKGWIKDQSGTIWIDEAADKNGICALITGSIDLAGWLQESDSEVNFFYHLRKKHPDFMRLRSCWEATRDFWEAVEEEPKAGKVPWRLHMKVDNPPGSLRKNWVYETHINGAQLAAVWTGQEFITASNLDYVARYAKLDDAEGVRRYLEAHRLKDQAFIFAVPRGFERGGAGQYQERGEASNEVQVRVASVARGSAFNPFISVTAHPRHLMAIGPATDSFAALDRILEIYDTRFGRVAGMLPIRLGLVFFDRRTPIYAVMQAGRKMLCMPARRNAAGWLDPRGSDFLKLAPGSPNSSSSVDFLHLETTGHRYRLAYDGKGRLDPERRHMPLSVEDFREMQRIWKILKGSLYRSQIYKVFSDIETVRESWRPDGPPDRNAVFTRLANALVEDAEWQPRPTQVDLARITEAAISGLLRETIEIYTKVLQQTGKEEAQ